MLKKIPPANKIAFAAFAASILGFLAQTYGFRHGGVITFISAAFYSISLQWISGHSLFDIIWVNQFLYLLLFLGAILYVFSKQKEARLVRFGFLLIFLSRVVTVFVVVMSAIFVHEDEFSRHERHLLSDIYFYVAQVGWLWLSYAILKYFNQTKAVDKTEIQYETTVYNDYTEASLWQRVFHLVIDTAIGVMLFYRAIDYWLQSGAFRHLLSGMESVFGTRLSLIILGVILRLTYFMLTEAIFGTTPGKLLTETRVITEHGDKPDAGTIIGRTFSRFVPFEPFSFFGARGWHDKWSGTMVAKEVRTGVKGANYFFIIPAALVLMFAFTFINEEVRAHKIKNFEIQRVALQRAKMDKMLGRLSTNDVLELDQKGSNFGFETTHLKVEKVDGDNITLLKIAYPKNHRINQLYLEELYKRDKATLERLTFSRQEIKKAFKSEREVYPVDGVPLNIKGESFYVKDIETFFTPNIKLSGADSYGPEFYVGLTNTGHPADISDVKVVQGDIEITSPGTQHIKSTTDRNYGFEVNIKGKTTNVYADFKINFTATDSLGRSQIYQIGGNNVYNRDNNERTIERLSP